MEVQVGGVLFQVVQGDITTVETDAVVNAANNHFWMGGGVAGAMKRAGGGNIESEAMSQGPQQVGESVVTDGGALPAAYVIHAAVMGQDLQTSAVAIGDATRSSLERAVELGIASIAFPAFGTGVGGFPPLDSAQAMVRAALSFIEGAQTPKLKRILFVLFSAELRDVFWHALSSATDAGG